MVEVVVILALILLNGVLAASELAIVSARPARLRPRADQGDAGAEAALALAAEPNRFLSTVQIGITLVGILAGAFGGAALSVPLAAALRQVGPVAPWAGPLSVALVVAAITYLSLIVGELVPKRLALLHPEAIASIVARPMRGLSRLAAPAVALLAVSSDLVLRLVGARRSSDPPVTEEEVEHLLQEGTRHGVFAETEREMVQGVFDLGDRRAAELMTPRHQVVFLDLAAPDDENRRRIGASPHTAYPVCDRSPDDVVGVVTAAALWNRAQPDVPLNLPSAMRPALVVPESAGVFSVLEHLRRTDADLALVVDEFGGVEGVLSMDDVVDAILPTVAAGDADEAAVERADGSWLLDGRLPAHELRARLGIAELPGEDAGEFETLGGFLMARLGRIPATGESVDWAGWRFEVADMDGHRIDKVLAARLPGEGERREARGERR